MDDIDVWGFPNFTPFEFECKCKGLYCDTGRGRFVDRSLVEGLEALRAIVGQPLYINSGVRCTEWNRNVGGTKTSQHLLGTAADVRISLSLMELGITAGDLARYAEEIPQFASGGIGVYNTFVHLDVRDGPARWDRRK